MQVSDGHDVVTTAHFDLDLAVICSSSSGSRRSTPQALPSPNRATTRDVNPTTSARPVRLAIPHPDESDAARIVGLVPADAIVTTAGDPEDVAPTPLSPCLPAASHRSGAIAPVDGGMSTGYP